MVMPKPGEAHKKLQRLVGEWTGAETLHPAPWDPKGGPATGRIVNRSIVDGFAVVQDYEQRRKGTPNFRGHGVFWYDQSKQQYVMTWWDSMAGTAGEYRGTFNGDVLELQSPMPQGGQARASFDLSKAGHYAFMMTISGDGVNWQPAMEGRYQKRSKAAKETKVRKAAKRTMRSNVSSKGVRRSARTSTRRVRKGARGAR